MPEPSHCQGSKVTIYEDPLTEQKPEGTATLVRCLTPAGPGDLVEEWIVKFSGESASYRRTIKI